MPLPQEAWFGGLEDLFARTARVGSGITDRNYLVGGLVLRLRFADEALLPLVGSALRHLERTGGPATADLTVLVCHSAPGEIQFPHAVKAFSPRGDAIGYNSDRFKMSYQAAGGVVTAFDARRSLAVHCIGAPEAVSLHERTSPMRGLFGWWLRLHGRQLVHGAAVGTPEGCVLLAGKGGSGKSNTALACLHAGFAFAGDDFCAIEPTPHPVVHSLFSTARSATADWARLPFLEPIAVKPFDAADGKSAYFLHSRYSDRLPPCMPVRAVVLPNVCDRKPPGLTRISPAAAVMAIAPCTVSILPDAGREVFDAVSALVRRVPCYRLDLGPDPMRVPALIGELLN